MPGASTGNRIGGTDDNVLAGPPCHRIDLPSVMLVEMTHLAVHACKASFGFIIMNDASGGSTEACTELSDERLTIARDLCKQVMDGADVILTFPGTWQHGAYATARKQQRASAAVPLIGSTGLACGAICVVDDNPERRHFTTSELQFLRALASQIVQQASLACEAAALADDAASKSAGPWPAPHIPVQPLTMPAKFLSHPDEGARAGKNQGLWDWDIVTGAFWFSDQWHKMLGYGPDDLEGRVHSFTYLLHPDDRTNVFAALNEHFEGRTESFQSEHRLRCKQGHWLWVSARGKVVAWDPEHRPLRAVGTHADISEHKAAEQYRAVLLSLDDALNEANTPAEVLDVAKERLKTDLGISDLFALPAIGSSLSSAQSDPPGLVFPVSNDAGTVSTGLNSQNDMSLPGLGILCGAGDNAILLIAHYHSGMRGAHDLQLLETALERVKSAFDTTALKEAVRDGEDHYLSTIELNPQISWTADPNGELLFVGGRWVEVSGMSLIETLAGGWQQLLHPDDETVTRQAAVSALASGKPLDVRLRLLLKDGEYRWFRSRASARLGRDGQILRWYGTLEDVHEHAMAELALRNSEARLRLALTAAGAGTWQMDASSHKVVLSPDSSRMLGLDPGQQHACLTIETWLALWHPADCASALASAQGALDAGGYCDIVLRTHPDNSGARWIHAIGRRQLDDAGRAEKISGLYIDVTRSRRIEEDLLESEASLQLALDVGQMATFDWNVSTGHIRWSPGHFRMLGYEVDAIEPSYAAWAARVHPDDLAEAEWNLLEARANGLVYEAKYRIVRPDGTTIWVEARGGYLDASPSASSRMIGILKDVSLRQAAEEAAEKAQCDLLKLSRLTAMGAMASTLAHELNQPLTAMTNYLGAAHHLSGRPGVSISEVQELIGEARAQTMRVAGIIKKIRSFTMTGQVTRVPVAPALILAAVERDLKDRLARANVTLVKAIAPGTGRVEADQLQIEQVLSNIVRNSIDAVEGRAERIINLTVRNLEQFVEFSIVDSGPGLPESQLLNLFGMFNSDKEEGLGLGLPICRTIIEAHGGRITAANRPSGGAQLVILLPASR